MTADERRPLILGEAPSRTGDVAWLCPLSGRVGERLCTWAGVEPLAEGSRYGRFYWPLRERYELRNLIARWPGAKGVGADFPMPRARELMAEEDWTGRRVILLGRRLMSAAGHASVPFHGWTESRGGLVAGIPHPSGLTRTYNDPAERERAGETLRAALQLEVAR